MLPIEPLGLSANQWQFLSAPDRYVEASQGSRRPLDLESTRRQFRTARDILARLNGSHGEEQRRGILLADDVGLGKTTVAALVAWVVASAGEKRRVRILVPNNVMMRRWEEELKSHVELLGKCAPRLEVSERRVKVGRGHLALGSIQIVKHSYAAKDFRLACDLLIVDEAHRAKGEKSAFCAALKRHEKKVRRVLTLTATPFSIHLAELKRMLRLIGGEEARGPVGVFSRALDHLYKTSPSGDPGIAAERLAAKAKAAVDVLGKYLIRHGVDDLPGEQASFGSCEVWDFTVLEAKTEELELLIRMDRALRLAKRSDFGTSKATNDPRFAVGWRRFDQVRADMEGAVPKLPEPVKAVIECQLQSIQELRAQVGVHAKMAAVAAAVKSTIERGEKVILFCHHHATAQELTVYLGSELPEVAAERCPGLPVWRRAWDGVLEPGGEERDEEGLRETFIKWLCADLIRAQTWNWLPGATVSDLRGGLEATRARHPRGETIAEAARRLYRALVDSKSSQAVLMAAATQPHLLPGANGAARVLGVCERIEGRERLFLQNQQPDTVISIFNSPFGPDVLVVTDRLSEGIDLHRYCRHLIHYELDPSPIRTVQRNGRLRRVNSWAAATGLPIRYAYPAFRGTRDHPLVQIMKKRIDNFSLLLGGVKSFDVEEVEGSEEAWRNQVIAGAKDRLATAGRQLHAREPGGMQPAVR